MKRLIVTLFMTSMVTTTIQAHHPDRAAHPVRPLIDVIGPLGNRLPPGYRRVYNRPSYLEGKIAYWIAPTTQEAMAWHRAEHAGLYDGHHPRQEKFYFYPKPWEVLQVGARPSRSPEQTSPSLYPGRGETPASDDALEMLPTPLEPLQDPLELPSDSI